MKIILKKQNILTRNKKRNCFIEQMKSKLILSHYFFQWIENIPKKKYIGYQNVDTYLKISMLYFFIYLYTWLFYIITP